MCFSPEADLVGGVVIGAIGIDTVRHAPERRFLPLAALPLLFGAHQLVETFVWWGEQGHVSEAVGRFATWTYLLFAFVVLPSYVPAAVYAIESEGWRRRLIGVFCCLGVAVSVTLLVAMLAGPVTAELEPYHISYGTGLTAGVFVVAGYVAVTCGSFLFSGISHLAVFGVVNLVAVAAVAALVVSGFASLWCAWAAVTSGAFALYLRRTDPNDAVVAAGT